MVVHIPVFGSFWADGGSEETLRSIVICLRLGRVLGTVKFIKGGVDWDDSCTIMVQGACFCFSSGGYDVAKCNTFSKDRPVGRGFGNGYIRRCVVVR